MPSVFDYYTNLAYKSRYRALFRVAALTKIGAVFFIRVLYTAYSGVASFFGKSTSLCRNKNALLSLPTTLLDVVRHLGPLSVVHEMEGDAAQSLVAFSHLESTDWTILASADPVKVFCVYYNFGSCAETMFLVPSVPYVVWLILDFSTASCRVHDYIDDKDRVSGPIWGTEGPVSAVKFLEFNMVQAVPTSSLFSLGHPLSFSPLPTSPQTSMAGSSPHVSTTSLASVISSFEMLAPLASPVAPPLLVLSLLSFLSLLVLVLAPRLAPVLRWLDDHQLCWFLPLLLSPVLVRS